MSKPPSVHARPHPSQQARFGLTVGRRTSLTAEVAVSPSGLLAIGALVSAILLSTAVIVHTARR